MSRGCGEVHSVFLWLGNGHVIVIASITVVNRTDWSTAQLQGILGLHFVVSPFEVGVPGQFL